ncbi:MAG: DUF3048 domain-containing protein [Actinomycetota bacterium]|nr:DUF3048 domain-containing protein [Actinomycetota bacterium]
MPAEPLVSTTLSPSDWVGPRHPLTGLPAPDGPSTHPALAVKIGNNDTNSLPQLGLEDADIVYEALIEAGKTRFLAVYHSEVPDLVGPVRSARSSDIDLIGNLNRPFFAYWGSNEGVGAEVADAVTRGTFVLRTTNEAGQGFFTRDPSRGLPPYDGVLEAADLMAFADGSAPEMVLSHGAPSGSPVPSLGVRWETGARQIDYLWDVKTSRWLRFQDGIPLVDGSGSQLAADNVLIIYVDYDRSIADPMSPQALSTGGGDGWLFRDGMVTGITWNRPFVADGWVLADDDTAVPVRLDYGTTWVALAQLGEASILDLAAAASLQR